MGFYAQAGYFITGESRGFSSKKGGWTRVRPKAMFWSVDEGNGAMEVAVRFDSTDLSDAGITGGEMTTFTIGFNWYWNPNTRMMVNYVIANIEDSPVNQAGQKGKINTFIIRWQIDF